MAKNKKTQAKPMKAEEYIRTRMRSLPIHKCYKLTINSNDRELNIIVIRKHPKGTYSWAIYALDKWCIGVEASFWHFNDSEEDLTYNMTKIKDEFYTFDEIEYVEAHNWVYGAAAFAEDAGILPCKDFELTKFFLEVDDDNVELIDYEFGRNGEHCLMVEDDLDESKYIPILDKTLGEGNYSVKYPGEEMINLPFEYTPNMEYTYEGGTYPSEIDLNFPELEKILAKDTGKITDEDIKRTESLQPDKLKEDLQNIILLHLGKQWGKSIEKLSEGADFNTIGNALIFLTAVATVDDSLPVLLEVMRQSHASYDFNFFDSTNYLISPLLCLLIKDNPRLIKPYLLEKGLETHFKLCALDLLGSIATQMPQHRQKIIDMTVELLNEYKTDLPQRTICDGTVVAFTISILVSTSAREHMDLIEELYATGLVNEAVEGHIEELRRAIARKWDGYPLPPMEPHSIIKQFRPA